jgi:hypothetical protein
MTYAIGTRAECDAIKLARDKLLGPALPGIQCGGGVHVRVPRAWDGEGEVPAGWTGYAGPIEHPTAKGEWGIDTGGAEVTKALANPETAVKLTQAEQTLLASKVATAVEKETWVEPKVATEPAPIKPPSGGSK